MLTELRTKIYSIGSTVSGSQGFYYVSEPQDTNYPHTNYFLVDDVIDKQQTGGKYDNFILQFSLFDRRQLTNGNLIAAATLEKTAEELITKFNAGDLSLTGYRLTNKAIQFIRPAVVVDSLYWQIIIQYNLEYERN